MYLAIGGGGQLSYTPSIECVLIPGKLPHVAMGGWVGGGGGGGGGGGQLSYTPSIEREETYPTFPYCKRKKLGGGLGTRLQPTCCDFFPLSLDSWVSP